MGGLQAACIVEDLKVQDYSATQYTFVGYSLFQTVFFFVF